MLNNLPHDNFGINFRQNEIGITIDNLHWGNNPNIYYNDCLKVNELFDSIFCEGINPFDVILNKLSKIVGNNYNIKRMESSNGEVCPKGVFRIFNSNSMPFPYHTDGFNYGNKLNKLTNIDRTLYPQIMNSNTNSIIAIILVLNQARYSKNEIELYN
jgi:hypothetical protein